MTLNIVFDVSSTLASLLEKYMATLADFQTAIAKVSTDIDTILQQIADLKAQLAAGGLSPDEEAQVLASINALDAKINPPTT